MGLVVANALGMSGLVVEPPAIHVVTSDGSTTYTIPKTHTRVYIECIGGGAGGGGGSGNSSARAGGGGGGGSFTRGIYDARAFTADLTIAVGAGGNGGAGGSSGNAGVDGVAGGTTSVTSGTFTLSAFGGGFGFKALTDSTNGGGGGGAGTGGAGSNGITAAHGDGGIPVVEGAAPNQSLGGQGGRGGDTTGGGYYSEYGGGGGGGGGAAGGGGSIYGAGGGAGGGGADGGEWGLPHQAAEGLAALSMIIQRQAQAVTAETAQLESIAGR